jgi:PAS domain S-box-containing protein
MEVASSHSAALDPVERQPKLTVGVLIADADLLVIHVEGAVFARHGSTGADWPGRALSEMLPAASLRELEPRYRAALGGEPQVFAYRSNDGRSAYWVQITPIRGEDGVVTSVVAVMQDVTESLTMMKELSRSEDRLRESERMVGVGSWEWVPETRVLTFSSGFERLLGLSTAEKLDGQAFWGMLEPEDRDILSRATRVCLSTGVASSEFRVRLADGEFRTFAGQAEAVDPRDGQPRYLRGAILDVTQEREAERERLDAVSLFRGGFDASPVGMAMTDPRTGSYTRVNDALCTLLQRPRHELLGLGVDSVTHSDDRAGNEEMRRVLRDPGVKSHHVEKRYLRPDGSSVWVIAHVTSVRDTRGSLRALFSQIIDITDRKQREAQFETQVNDALWLGRIRDALDGDRFVLYSQPIVDLFTGETVQRELLIRMLAEDGSIIAPGEFLPVAERYGLISEVDRWVIRKAVGLAAHGEPTEFNLSAASIGDPDIARELASAIEQTGVDPSLLVVEVTETAMMNQLDAGRLFAERVTALGCRLALDDFGTGYASLSY